MGNIITESFRQFSNQFTSMVGNSGNTTYSVIDKIEENNPKYKQFFNAGTKRQEIISRMAISSPEYGQEMNHHPMSNILIDNTYSRFMYATIDPDKVKRLREYRIMAAYSELSDALEEICDEFIAADERGDNARVLIKNPELDKEGKAEIEKEFKRIIRIFDLKNKGWEYARTLLTEGEIYFENIISKDKPHLGILGISSIPTEFIDPIYDNVQNLIVKGFLLRKPVIDQKTNIMKGFEPIIFDKNQVTYFHSHLWDETKSFRMPFIERARRAYKLLSLIEDSIIIHRLANAPDKLVFKVDVGNMAAPKAEAYIKNLMHTYYTKKTYDANQGNSTNIFNPASTMDAYWFPKRQGSEGTTVEKLAGSQNFGSMEDLDYFVRKLYNSLKVPTNRLNKESTFNDSAEMLREELSFAKFIIRIQQHFADAIKETFITHLKLRDKWDAYSLKEHDIEIELVPPTNFYILRNQQIFELRVNNFNSLVSNESISTTYALKKYLGWNDIEIQQNIEHLKRDYGRAWELAQIQQYGPNWREIVNGENQKTAEGFDPSSGAGGGGGGASAFDSPGGGAGGAGGGESALPQPEEQPTPPEAPEAETETEQPESDNNK